MAFDTYMQIGDGTDAWSARRRPRACRPERIEIFSFSWGASNPDDGRHDGRRAVRRQGLGLQLQRHEEVGEVLADLFAACCTGQHYAKAQVVMRKAAGTAGKQSTFMQYDFTDVMVESIQWSGSSGGDDTPTESVSFAFAKVKITYNKQDRRRREHDDSRRATPVGT